MNVTQNFLPPPVNIPVTYITTAVALEDCIQQLSQANELAFDLEFDRDHYTYGFNLCFLQIASSTHCYLIDPIADLDISLIFPILENAAIHKVVHSSAEDMRLLHSLQCYPTNLADTELYAKLLNYERTSLGALLQQLFGIELDKKMQKVNWVLRPLGEQQLNYAAKDVLYLLPLKKELEKQAARKNLLPFLQAENDLLTTTIHQTIVKDNFLKKNDLLFLSPYDQYVLNGIFVYRDALAKEQNKPAHFIMNEETARRLAANEIHHSEWLNIKGTHPVIKTNEGQEKLFGHIQSLNAEAHHKQLSIKKNKRERGEEFFRGEQLKKELKENVFTPIQNEIAANLGEHAMRFVFSNAAVDDLLQGRLKVGDLKSSYRGFLVRSAAQKLNISITEFE